LPNTPQLNGVLGSAIFPNRPMPAARPEVDVFYAALPSDPAYEVATGAVAATYHGIFTECLLAGLTQVPPAAVEERLNPPPRRWVVSSWTMKRYLEERVPEAVAEISLKLVQTPEIRVESHLPNCLVECPGYRPPAHGEPPPGGSRPPR